MPYSMSEIHLHSWSIFHLILLMEEILKHFIGHTLPETNIAPENRPSQKETTIPTIHFQVLC